MLVFAEIAARNCVSAQTGLQQHPDLSPIAGKQAQCRSAGSIAAAPRLFSSCAFRLREQTTRRSRLSALQWRLRRQPTIAGRSAARRQFALKNGRRDAAIGASRYLFCASIGCTFALYCSPPPVFRDSVRLQNFGSCCATSHKQTKSTVVKLLFEAVRSCKQLCQHSHCNRNNLRRISNRLMPHSQHLMTSKNSAKTKDFTLPISCLNNEPLLFILHLLIITKLIKKL